MSRGSGSAGTQGLFMKLESYFICTFLPVIKNSSKTQFFNLSLSIVVSSSFTTIYLQKYNRIFGFSGLFLCVYRKGCNKCFLYIYVFMWAFKSPVILPALSGTGKTWIFHMGWFSNSKVGFFKGLFHFSSS